MTQLYGDAVAGAEEMADGKMYNDEDSRPNWNGVAGWRPGTLPGITFFSP